MVAQEPDPTVALQLAAEELATAVSFYQTAFGAVETQRECLLDGSLLCVDLAVGDRQLTLSEYGTLPGGGQPPGRAGAHDLRCAQPDAVVSRAVAAGATRELDPADAAGSPVVRDPFGQRWVINPG